jgi:hypothetical protein
MSLRFGIAPYRPWATGVAALAVAFAAVYPVLKSYPLRDGEQDVVFQRILDFQGS